MHSPLCSLCLRLNRAFDPGYRLAIAKAGLGHLEDAENAAREAERTAVVSTDTLSNPQKTSLFFLGRPKRRIMIEHIVGAPRQVENVYAGTVNNGPPGS